ncbi:MAG TPA: NAD+ synthase [Candidatus Desulfobacillus sp.]|nr:NAD+ synthase [Candidatus Desulfobacillus sp.]
MPALRLALAQIDCVVGDLAGNAARIAAFAERARAAGARLMLTPELALSGYPPEDLLLRPDFQRACARELAGLAGRLEGIDVVVGHPEESDGRRYNAASLLRGGRVAATYRKQRLPNYDVFDEQRYFSAGDAPCVVEVDGVRCGLAICADIWEAGPAEAALAAGAELLLVLNASPWHAGKQEARLEVLGERARGCGLPLLYANLVGGQDELVFDGGSLAVDREGRLACRLGQFEEALECVDFAGGALRPGAVAPAHAPEAEIYGALVLGLRDYVGKNGFPGVLLGLSGGIDSALVLAVAVDALGPGRVRALMLPSPHTADMSREDARALAGNLGVRYEEMPIAPAMQAFGQLLGGELAAAPAAAGITEENLQARIRGMILMALSNLGGELVLTTGNKSETAVGYSTLYGDMAGGFAVLKDLYKTLVYRVARYRNGLGASAAIPERILTRAPSAELRPGQTDQDTLPPYETLDAIIEAYVERDLAPAEIVALGHAEADVRRVVAMIRRSEYKRRQSPVGIRLTGRGFGKDWRYPITSGFAAERQPPPA